MITSHRIIWGKPGDIPSGKICLSLPLRYVIFFEEESPGTFSFGRSSKVVLHLSEPSIGNDFFHSILVIIFINLVSYFFSCYQTSSLDKLPGPVDSSTNMYIKFSFKDGFDANFMTHLADVIMKKAWIIMPIMPSISPSNQSTSTTKQQLPVIKTRTGIIGIERSLQERQKATDESISIAFQDLRKLMEMAKDMVSISKTISAKIRVIVKLSNIFQAKQE